MLMTNYQALTARLYETPPGYRKPSAMAGKEAQMLAYHMSRLIIEYAPHGPLDKLLARRLWAIARQYAHRAI